MKSENEISKEYSKRINEVVNFILKNLTEKKYEREEYFKYYFFQIDKLNKDKLKMTDLSGTLRRNRINVFEKEF